MFISMLYLVLNLDTHQLSFARAGHEPPILIRAGEPKADVSETAGIAIGLVDPATFEATIETRNLTLRPGDLVVCYTDGITEAMNSAGEEWGVERLIACVEKMADAAAGDLLDNMLTEVKTFTGDNRQSDDMTMLALKVK